MTRGKPTHGLEEVKRRVAGGAFVITLQARRDAYRLGLDAQDVRVCIAVPELRRCTTSLSCT
jgi:hypothetical protein